MTEIADLQKELEDLRAEIAGLRDRKLPKVDRSSRRRDRRQTVLALSAVVLTLGLSAMGTASALDGTNTVFSDDIADLNVKWADIADSAVNGRKIAGNSITTGKVLDKSLLADDLADSAVNGRVIENASVTSSDVAWYTLGQAEMATGGVDSRVLKDGSVGAADLAETAAYDKRDFATSGYVTISSTSGSDIATAEATCPAGTHVISGGPVGITSNASGDVHVLNSYANFDANSWNVQVHISDGIDPTWQKQVSWKAQAYCLK